MQCFAKQFNQRAHFWNIYQYHGEHVCCGLSELYETVWERLIYLYVNPGGNYAFEY